MTAQLPPTDDAGKKLVRLIELAVTLAKNVMEDVEADGKVSDHTAYAVDEFLEVYDELNIELETRNGLQ